MGSSAGTRAADDAQEKLLAEQQRASAALAELTPQKSEFGKLLAEGAMGRAPSIAEAQLRMAQDRNLKQQLAAAKANKAVNPALAARNLQRAQTESAAQTAQDTAIARLQEQRQQQQAFSEHLGNLQSASIGAAQARANAAAQFADAERQESEKQFGQVGRLAGAVGSVMAGPAVGGFLSALGGAKKKAHGGVVEGSPKVKGDSTVNDTQPHMLSPGEVVVPRTLVDKGDKAAAEFIKKAREIHSKQEKGGFASVVAAKAELERVVEQLNKKYGKE